MAGCWVAPTVRPTCTTWCLCCWARGCVSVRRWPLEWADLDLHADIPYVRVAATLVAPRRDAATGQVFVAGLHRQPMTKPGAARTIALPCVAVEMLNRRRAVRRQHRRQPVFAHAGGGWLWPNNMRTKLRCVVAGTPLVGTSPHTLRRTVGTLVAHSEGLDASTDPTVLDTVSADTTHRGHAVIEQVHADPEELRPLAHLPTGALPRTPPGWCSR